MKTLGLFSSKHGAHSASKYLLGANYVSGTVPGTGDTGADQSRQNSWLTY
jgi:hypothetical protein